MDLDIKAPRKFSVLSHIFQNIHSSSDKENVDPAPSCSKQDTSKIPQPLLSLKFPTSFRSKPIPDNLQRPTYAKLSVSQQAVPSC